MFLQLKGFIGGNKEKFNPELVALSCYLEVPRAQRRGREGKRKLESCSNLSYTSNIGWWELPLQAIPIPIFAEVFLTFFTIFKNYTLLIMLIQLSWFFPLWLPPPKTPHSLRQSPYHCSCPWVMHISALATPFPKPYFTSPWLFYNYIFVLLNPLTSSLIPSNPSPTWQPSKHPLYPWFCLCSSCLLSLLKRLNCW